MGAVNFFLTIFIFFPFKKWSSIEPEQGIAKLQGLLDLALQRSSCGNDPYKEKLFIYAKGQNMVSQPTSAIGMYGNMLLQHIFQITWGY